MTDEELQEMINKVRVRVRVRVRFGLGLGHPNPHRNPNLTRPTSMATARSTRRSSCAS
jgi:hypothetical protein